MRDKVGEEAVLENGGQGVLQVNMDVAAARGQVVFIYGAPWRADLGNNINIEPLAPRVWLGFQACVPPIGGQGFALRHDGMMARGGASSEPRCRQRDLMQKRR